MSWKFPLSVSSTLLALCAGCSSMSEVPPPATVAAQRASCGTLTVQPHASAGEVLSACGQPSYRDAWGANAAAQGPNLAAVEEWYYNAGPQRPVQVLRFLNGQLTSVSEDGYGFEPAKPGADCDSRAVTPGLSKYRLVQNCGEPLTRQAYVLDPSYSFPNAPVLSQGNAMITGQTQNAQPVYREDLAYKLAGGAVKTVTLENGRVLQVGDSARRG